MISAVVPTYNRGDMIERALRSILDQVDPPDEVIVVDDGSTDDTEAVVAQFGDAVRYHRQPNGGASVARNTGVGLARGDFIAFLDSDDMWLPGHMAALRAAGAGTHWKASLYFADCYFSAPGTLAGDSTLWSLAQFSPQAPFEFRPDPTEWALLPLQPTMLQASMFSKAAYLSAGGLDRRMSLRHDTGIFFALAVGHPWCAVSHIGTRMTPDAANRLTAELPSSGEPYWRQTVILYEQAAAVFADRPKAERDQIRDRLAFAHWRLSRLGWKKRDVAQAITELGRAVRTKPSTVAQRLLHIGH